jgi:UDP-N-acetylmuramoylalanine--D-glutamate ligase
MKSLFGYGITTKSISKNGGWNIFDDKFTTPGFDKFGNKLLPSSYFDPEKSKLEIASPGIPPFHPLIKKAKNLISEFDYFYEKAPFQIWITGTNGKTTTTQMIHNLLEDSEIGGNIGIPLAELKKNKRWVIEASSFQLYYTKYAKPNIFVVLPIKEDHISWHGSFENYVKAKLSPLKRMTQRDVVIMPKKFDSHTKAYKILYENERDLIDKFGFKRLKFEHPFSLNETLAKTVAYVLEFKEKDLTDFKIDPHKIEEFYDSKNRLWVDDSKATNIDATLNALKRYENKKIYLIIGGVDKGQNFEKMFGYLSELDLELIIIGEERGNFLNLAKKFKIKHHDCKNLRNAIEFLNNIHDEKSVVLLSPACASFDQFKNYVHRGEEFKKWVKNL